MFAGYAIHAGVRRRALPIVWLILPIFPGVLGCGGQHQRVEYDRPAMGPVRELAFKQTSFGATNVEPEAFSDPIEPDEQLAFAGQVDAELPSMKVGVLRIVQQRNSRRITSRSSRVMLEAVEDGKSFRFRSEVKAPQKPGQYQVEIKVRQALLALGEITVRKPGR